MRRAPLSPAPPAPPRLAEEPARRRLVRAPRLRLGRLGAPAGGEHPGPGGRLGGLGGAHEDLVQDHAVPGVTAATPPSSVLRQLLTHLRPPSRTSDGLSVPRPR